MAFQTNEQFVINWITLCYSKGDIYLDDTPNGNVANRYVTYPSVSSKNFNLTSRLSLQVKLNLKWFIQETVIDSRTCNVVDCNTHR